MCHMFYIWCGVVLLLTQVADYWSSRKALKLPGTVEMNFVVRAIGLLGSKILSSGVLVLVTYLCCYSHLPGLLALITIVCSAVYAWIVNHNLTIASGTTMPGDFKG